MGFFIVYLQILNELYLGAIRKTTKKTLQYTPITG